MERPFKNYLIRCAFLSLVLHILAAYYSWGFYLYDEHYQILEFAWMKLGKSTPGNMAWEYAAQSRPSFQPWIVIAFAKAIGMSHPFRIAFALRLTNALLGFTSLLPFALYSMRWIKNDYLKKIYPLLLASLPIIAFVHARFSSEGMACSFFLWGVNFLLFSEDNQDNKKILLYSALAGISFSLAFVCRIQIAITFPAIIIWAVFIKKTPLKSLILILVAFLGILLFSFLLDKWFYGEWVNALWNYFRINFLEGIANSFGKSPPWFYFQEVLGMAGPVPGIACILLVIIAWIRNPKNIMVLCLSLYFIVHCMIGHKEMRFLFPMVIGLPLFFMLAIDGINNKALKDKGIVYVRRIALALYLLLVIFWVADDCLSPARVEFYAYKYLDRYKDKKMTLISLYKPEWPYGPKTHLNMDFYKPAYLINKVHMPGSDQLKPIIDSSRNPVYLYSMGNGFKLPDEVKEAGVQYKLEYTKVPEWLLRLNFNHWVDRLHNAKVYRLYH